MRPLPDWTAAPSGAVLAGAGDIAVCALPLDEATAGLLDRIPGTVFTAGDNAYPDGSPKDFRDCYAPGWGRHRARTRPSPGNHDYHTAGAAGYFAYFGAAAGPPGLGYYGYRLNGWHVIALNSEADMGPGSPQASWLAAELAANPVPCVAAYWHRPLFSSGTTHGGAPKAREAWSLLYAAGAELVVNGHEHHYERFAPQRPDGTADPAGIRQFVAGTGGRVGYPFGRPAPNSEVRRDDRAGILALHLLPGRYEWAFLPVGGGVADSGSAACHDPPGGAATNPVRAGRRTPPVGPAGNRVARPPV